jgi:hypothetical protein
MPAAAIKHYHQGACPCCGTETACTRGIVINDNKRIASYLIKWTVGDPSHAMGWLVSLPDGEWGREVSVSLAYSVEHGSFMVRHRGRYSWNADDLAGFGDSLDRDQVIGTPLAERVFSVVDHIWLTNPYVREFGTPPEPHAESGPRDNHSRPR